MDLTNFSVVHKNYRDKDPRSLPFLYPETINIVAYAKNVQVFSFYQTLEVAEQIVNKQGFLLLPWKCIHWERARDFGADRRIKIGRRSFFMMQPKELTKTEKSKLANYIDTLNSTSIYDTRS